MCTDNYRSILLNLSLGILLLPVTLLADNVVVGEGPGVYSVPALEQLQNDLNLAKKKQLSQKDLLDISAKTHEARVLNARELDQSLAVRAMRSDSAGPRILHSSSTASLARVYYRFGTPLQIPIYDGGYGLSEKEKELMHLRLAQMPTDLIKGIKGIEIRPYTQESPGIHYEGDRMVVYASKGDDVYPFNQAVRDVLAVHVFQNVLTDSQRRGFAAIFPGFENAVEMLFLTYFVHYLHNGQEELDGATVSADAKVYREYLRRQGITAPELFNPMPYHLQAYLFVASLFVESNTGVVRMFSNDQMSYERARYTGSWLTIGKTSYALQGGAVVGFTTVDVHAPPSSPATLISYSVWNPPVAVPQILLNRIGLKQK